MAKTNVNYVSKRFSVNRKKNEVYCTITCEINLDKIPLIASLEENDRYQSYIADLIFRKGMNMYDYTYNGDITNHGVLAFTTTASARCSNNDEFDETIGYRVSLTRAQAQAFIIARDIYNKFVNILSHDMDKLKNIMTNCKTAHVTCANHAKNNF